MIKATEKSDGYWEVNIEGFGYAGDMKFVEGMAKTHNVTIDTWEFYKPITYCYHYNKKVVDWGLPQVQPFEKCIDCGQEL